MKVSELGEFGLIDLLSGITGGNQSKARHNLLIGIGDDAAAWRNSSPVQLATTDNLVEGVHFRLDATSWRQLGWKALAVSLSDIAAMGGVPLYTLVSLALPGDTIVEDITELYHGMVKLADEFGVVIAGGNCSSAPLVVINTTVFGKTPGNDERMLARSAAAAGDKIAVSGYPGGAAGGLAVLNNNLKLNERDAEALKKALLQPQPRVNEGQILLKEGVKAAIDISDGLLADMGHICKASGVGARIEVKNIPLHPALIAVFDDGALDMALCGGEDYELLFTAPEDIIKKAAGKISCPITIIGEITENSGKIDLIDASGKPYRTSGSGWQHFKH